MVLCLQDAVLGKIRPFGRQKLLLFKEEIFLEEFQHFNL